MYSLWRRILVEWVEQNMKYSHCYLSSDDGDRYYCSIKDDKDNDVGWCKYYKPSIYTESVCIEYIYISEDYQRKGYATQMVMELRRKYGNVEWDYQFTDKGRKWFDAMIKKGVISV